TRHQTGRHQLRFRGDSEVLRRPEAHRFPAARRPRFKSDSRLPRPEHGSGRTVSRNGPARLFLYRPEGHYSRKVLRSQVPGEAVWKQPDGETFSVLGQEVVGAVQAPHLEVGLQQSDRTGVPGGLITLVTEVRLPRDTHVYAPGTKGYKPIELVIEPAPNLEFRSAIYPQSRVLFMSAIKERVPVFEGTFRIRQDVKVSSAAAFSGSLSEAGKTLTIHGTLHYQACDNKTCFLPNAVPVEWQLHVLPLDRQR